MNNPVLQIYQILHQHYGDLKWWPAQTPYEVMVGAILTQNTNWSNVEKAIANFPQLSPEFVQKCELSQLKEIIYPAGFFNQKAVYLKEMTEWFAGYNFCVHKVQQEPLAKIRKELLSVKGIGRETADSILLYALSYPSFVIDAYTQRLCRRYMLDVGNGYELLKAYFENHLPTNAQLYNNYHALIVMLAKDYCRKSKPLCSECPLEQQCEKHGL